MKTSPVNRKAQDRPLTSIRETKNLISEGALNKQPKGPHRTFDQPHSKRSQDQSVRYHAKIMGGRQSAAQVTDQLNPDRTLPAKRSYPGLAN
jgi:hypothetical protein